MWNQPNVKFILKISFENNVDFTNNKLDTFLQVRLEKSLINRKMLGSH